MEIGWKYRIQKMRTTQITTLEDIKWMLDVHFPHIMNHFTFPQFVVAQLHGNEDSPEKIELFAQDHYRCKPWVYLPDENGKMKRNILLSLGAGKLRPKTKREHNNGCL